MLNLMLNRFKKVLAHRKYLCYNHLRLTLGGVENGSTEIDFNDSFYY